MRITKRQLRRIIKEERARLAEYGVGTSEAAERAIGMYFDVRMMESFAALVDDMYENALTAAMDDIGDVEEAGPLVQAGIRKLFEEELSSRR